MMRYNNLNARLLKVCGTKESAEEYKEYLQRAYGKEYSVYIDEWAVD